LQFAQNESWLSRAAYLDLVENACRTQSYSNSLPSTIHLNTGTTKKPIPPNPTRRLHVSINRKQLRAGSIVWAILRDERGYRKRRPAIILTPDEEISEDQPLALMAITTTYPDPTPADHIELPWNSDARKVSTHLVRRSAAVISWLATVYLDEIDQFIGTVPPARMRLILSRLGEIQAD